MADIASWITGRKGKKKFAHGSMEILEGGVVVGRTDPKHNGHPANYALNLDHGDAIYEFEIKLEGGDISGGILVGYHKASCKIAPDHIGVGKQAKTSVDLAKNEWHKVTVTRIGTRVTVRVGEASVEGEEPKLTPILGSIRLTVKGADGSASYRDLKIWKAVPQ